VTYRSRIVRWNGDGPVESSDEIAAEEPLEIRIGGEPVSVTMRTPGHDSELVAGLLLSESLITFAKPPLLRQEKPNVVNVAINRDPATARHASVVSASCGLCGKASIEAVHQHFPPVDDAVRISRGALLRMVDRLASAQDAFARTGGVHAAALFDANEALLVAREDIGRHNAVDKVIGHALLRGLLPLRGFTLVVSGRASFEIVQKALGARIPVIAAVSAPSSLAVQLADESEQTLAGFVRGDRCNIYTHAERIVP
jgi:FdhD protein